MPFVDEDPEALAERVSLLERELLAALRIGAPRAKAAVFPPQPAVRMFIFAGVEEIFDVRVLPGSTCVTLRGPSPEKDGQDTIWVVLPR
jgi:hypothetical protein